MDKKKKITINEEKWKNLIEKKPGQMENRENSCSQVLQRRDQYFNIKIQDWIEFIMRKLTKLIQKCVKMKEFNEKKRLVERQT